MYTPPRAYVLASRSLSQQRVKRQNGLVKCDWGTYGILSKTNWFSFSPGVNPTHNDQVCSTWGNFHFKTFDGDIFQLPSTCNYVLTSLCHSNYEDFNIQMRRQVVDNQPTISKITMRLDGLVVELSKGSIVVNGKKTTSPFSQSGILIEETPSYIKISAKLGFVAIWNQEDSFMVEMDIKFRNQTCGLCGDFNGLQQFDEFHSHGMTLSPADFGNFWKLDGPTESCTENPLLSNQKCTNLVGYILLPAFSSCKDLLAVDSFVGSCESDLCHCDNHTKSFCLCNTISEYSRQCLHAGGKPKQWRTEKFCFKTCPFNMEYQECGNPCVDTCSNPERGQLCEDHCSDGCFCPPDTVFDDVNKNGCIALSQCSCRHNGKSYAPGESYSSTCKDCSCSGGQWKCKDKDCPGTCSVEGGSHINTFDGKAYTFHGDCSYVLTKDCYGMQFTVLGDLVKCGLSDSQTCLKAVTLALSGGTTVINIQENGKAFVNGIYSQLPFSAAGLTILRASSFFIIVQTTFGLQLEIQISPILQVYIKLAISQNFHHAGLCGNFNNNQGDDLKGLSGVTEGTAIGFANTWKTRASCPDITRSFESRSLSLENEKYAQHWCSQIADPKGLFAPCHATISPDMYKENCMYDTNNCEKSEDCMCAAVSSYVHACSAEGIQIKNWRDTICTKYSTSCPSTMVYTYSIKSNGRSCRCNSDPDYTCSVTFEPVDGCVCSEGTFQDDEGKCVPPASCPCYYKGSVVPPGNVISKDQSMCTCTEGKIHCIGDSSDHSSCVAPMVFFNCSKASPGVRGLECQKSCNILDMACISTECISGCMCPSGLVSDGKGGCIQPDLCPCSHNGAVYQRGDSIKVDCNTCTCKDRRWQCTTNLCHGTCAIYGEGHYITFDEKRYTFEGDCEYILTEDYCGNNNTNGSFRVITENVPCGTTGTTCSKAIKIFLGNNELILTEGKYQVIERNRGEEVPYQIYTMGIYLVIEAQSGLILMWDRKTSMFIKLSPQFKGNVCGLCGNYDGNAKNDFTSRNQEVVVNPLDFGNSWKVSASCPDAKSERNPCTANPYRQSWSQRQCSIIQSDVFTACHSKVDPSPYYDACVRDSCGCDSGGDCECFCTAVAAYAMACNEAGACIAWRKPEICPLFCDYYNPPGECEWHYKPCGTDCMKTCRNRSGNCSTQIPPLEGCYPKCPPDQPFFDEDTMKCVKIEQCGCYDSDGIHYNNGEKVPVKENCQTWYAFTNTCSLACTCTYNGTKYTYGQTIYDTTDGHENCFTASCGENGTIHRNIYYCSTARTSSPSSTVTTSVFIFSTPVTTSTVCSWSQWFNVDYPQFGPSGGDNESIKRIIESGYKTCEDPVDVVCQGVEYPGVPLSELGQNVECNTKVGLICQNKNQGIPPICLDYEIKLKCCEHAECHTTTPVTRTTSTATTKQMSTSTVTTSHPTTVTTTPTTTHGGQQCVWSDWINLGQPTSGPEGGDDESIKNIIAAGYPICSTPEAVECRSKQYPSLTISQLGQDVICDSSIGLICNNNEQGLQPTCFDYEIRVKCCEFVCTTPTSTTITTTGPNTITHKPSSTSTSTAPGTTKTTTHTPTTTQTTPTTTQTTPTTTPITPTTTETTPTTTQTTPTTTETIPTTTQTKPTTTQTIPTTTQTKPTTTKTTVPTTTKCSGGQQCVWSDWINLGQPTSGPEGGDDESIKNIIAAGYHICSTPEAVECRSKQFPSLTISQLGQDVTCDSSIGLICNNNEQGLQQTCFDYEIRVKCCEFVCTTPTSTTITTTGPNTITHKPSSTSTSTAPGTTKTTTHTPTTTETTPTTTQTTPTTTETIPTTTQTTPTTTQTTPTTTETIPTTTQTKPTTTQTIPTTTQTKPTTTQTTVPTTTKCSGGQQCVWSDWINLGQPTSGPEGGDDESIKNIIAAGYHICSTPEAVECRSKQYPSLTISQLGQDVTCDSSIGLICNNNEQGLQQTCFDYEIRVKCCEFVCTTPTSTTITTTGPNTITHKPSSTSTSTAPGTTKTTTHTPTTTQTTTTTTQTTPTTTPITPTTTETTPTTTQTTPTTTETIPTTTQTKPTTTQTIPTTTQTKPTTTQTTVPTTTKCSGGQQCVWSDWINLGQPTSGPEGGDDESIKNIIAAGYHICSTPEAVECRSKQYPSLTISQLGQDVTCDSSIGLICNNNEQGLQQTCFDYEIRVKCCEFVCTTPTSTTITTTGPNTITHKPSSTSTSTAPGTTKTTTHTPTTTQTTPTTTQTTTTTTPITPTTTETTPTTTQTTPTTTETIPTTTQTKPTTTQTIPTTTQTKPTTTQTTVPTTTKCSGGQQCVWSDWINLGQPTSGPEGGDDESIKNIIAAGYHICSTPEAVECRSKQYPSLTISQLGQDVTCDSSIGLICNNNEQGLQQTCFDYEIRVKCCEFVCTTPTSTTITTTGPNTITHKPSSTSTSTAPGTTKTTTHTPTTTQTTTTTTQTTPTTTPITPTTTETTPTTTQTTPTTTETIPTTTQTKPTTTQTIPTTTQTKPTTTQTTVPTTTKCSGGQQCVWSDWINLGQPTSGPEGGDDESIKNIIAAGYHICSMPEAVECRSKQYPSLTISQLGQDVTCDSSIGLICNNNEQGLQQTCFDYEIRVKCCEFVCTTPTSTTITTTGPNTITHKPSSTSTSTAPGTTKTTTHTPTTTQTTTTTTQTTPTTTPITPTTTETTPTTTQTTPTTTETIPTTTQTKPTTTQTIPTTTQTKPTTTQTTVPTTTKCSGGQQCVWSDWINLGQPTSGPEGGDDESIKNIIAAGYHICSMPEAVECRSKQYPSLTISQLGQDVTCDSSIGLICNNNEQGLQQTCFDYEIRVKCCEFVCTTPTSTTITTTGPNTITHKPSST
uniref:VWFD domain-containing protein n=1 Tax=Esox lucius TaxID=8010 RepID=A0AAY5K163_ESOLU